MSSNDDLEMKFDPKTIEHLGVRMYSRLPPVLSELIANSYDADAEHVEIKLYDKDPQKRIVISDDGDGMTYDEINQEFLVIGRNRRKQDGDKRTKKGRKVIGKKGLGKLSFFGISHDVEIHTKKGNKYNAFSMRWEDIERETTRYKPRVLAKNQACDPEEHGTSIILNGVARDSPFLPHDIAVSLSRIFIVDDDFKITIIHNEREKISVDNSMRYESLDKQIEWKMPDDAVPNSGYEHAQEIKGNLIATEKPISPNTDMRGITLFSRSKLVNSPEYFSDSTSSHFFSYLTGWLEVDFIDEIDEDVISTDRQSLNWDHPQMAKLREYLRTLIGQLETDWHKKRSEIREKRLSEASGINVGEWFATMPADIKSKVKPIVEALIRDSELPEETNEKVVKSFHDLVPEYPKYHWRHLHTEVRDAAGDDYKREDYYRAFQEAAKRYINRVRTISSNSTTSSRTMMGQVFGSGKPISVAQNFKKSDGSSFENQTLDNIEEGQMYLSMGVVAGCRNPVEHEEIPELNSSGMFTEKDCLDALSILSYLFHRLDNAKT